MKENNMPEQERREVEVVVEPVSETVADTDPAKEGKKQKEPLFHLIRRANATPLQATKVRSIAIVAGLILCGILAAVITKTNPFVFYGAMFKGAFGSAHNILVLVHKVAILLGVSLAVTPAFKMRFWNTGAEGQVLVGALATASCMYWFGSLPLGLLLVCMLLSALAAGAIWGIIPAVCKAKWGTNETLFTLMLNYVAMQLISFFMKIWNKNSASIDFTHLDPTLRINHFFNGSTATGIRRYLIEAIVIITLTVGLYVYLRFSKHGYELSVVGESENTAKYVGINVKKVIIRTMALSGMICGLIGFLLAGTTQTVSPGLADGRGFTAIMVSWLAKFDPAIMVFAALLLVFLDVGASYIATDLGVDQSFAEIISGILLFFIIGCEFFIQYRLVPSDRLVNRFPKLFGVKEKKEEQ